MTAITESAYDERGPLSGAFAPDDATRGTLLRLLTASAAAAASGTLGELQVREYRRSAADPDIADPASARLVLSIPHTDAPNHDKGTTAPGPADIRACAFSARVTGVRSVRRLRRLTASQRTDEACRATVSARIRGVATFRTAKRSLTVSRRSVVRLRLAVRVRAIDATGDIGALASGVRVPVRG